MPDLMNTAAEQRLQDYFDRIGKVLGRPERRASFAVYAFGLLGDGERKSLDRSRPGPALPPRARRVYISACIISRSIRPGTIKRSGARPRDMRSLR